MNRSEQGQFGSFGSYMGGNTNRLSHQCAQGTALLRAMTWEHDTGSVGDENEGFIQV